MRRAVLAVLPGGLLPVAGCDHDAKNESAPPAPKQTVPASLPPLPDYSVNTKQVCDRLKTLYSGELRDFGTAMGKMVSYQEANQAAGVEKAETEAAGKLKAAGAKIRQWLTLVSTFCQSSS